MMSARDAQVHSPQPTAGTQPDSSADVGADHCFVVVGSERSGTTLFRLMLDHHPELSCMFESNFMVDSYSRLKGKPAAAFANAIREDWHFRHSGLQFPADAGSYRAAVDSFFCQRRQQSRKRIVGATFHRGFQHLPEMISDAKYIHLIRDGRPVAASIVNMGWAGNTYHGARRWQDTIRRVLALQSRIDPDRWLMVRYEDLVTAPQAELNRVCRFLCVEYDEAMLQYPKRSTYDPPDADHAQRWKKRMSPREILESEMAARPELLAMGYEPLFPSCSPSVFERLFLATGNRLGRFCFNTHRYGWYAHVIRKLRGWLRIPSTEIERRHAAIRDAHVK